MAKKDFLVSIDLNKNELLNAKLQNLGALPNPSTGDTGYVIWHDNTAKFWTGTYWKTLEETIATNLGYNANSTTISLTPITGSLSGLTTTLSGATSSAAGLLTATMYDKLVDAVTKTDYEPYSMLVSNIDNTPVSVSASTYSVIGRISGIFQSIPIDTDLTNVSSIDDSLASAKAIKDYVDSVASPTGHTHYQLHQPNGVNPFVYTDNSGTLHIDGNIVQSGSSYETHAEQVYTKNNTIILRDGAVVGLGTGEYAGFVAKLYDGVNDGELIFDNTGTARVGDVGNLQAIATRIETPSDGYFAYWENGNTRLNFKQLSISDLTNLNTWTGSTAITSVGTIVSGTWHGSLIESQYGGTGINNGGRTITINTNSGIFSFTNPTTTLTVVNNASVAGTNSGDQTITLNGEVSSGAMTNGTYSVTLSNSAVISKVLSGYTATSGTITATDSILTAIQKLGYDKHIPVTINTNSGLSLTGQELALGTPSFINATSTNSVITNTHTHAVSGLTTANLAVSAGILNTQLANSSITIGSTLISLGATTTVLSGLTSVSATTFTGSLVGNASTANTLFTARNIALSGDVTGTATSFNGSSDITIPVVLNNIISAGTFTQVVVNAKGLVTSGTTPTTLLGYGITDAYKKFATTITGNGVATSFTITHNLNNENILTSVRDDITKAKVEVEEIIINANALSLNFNTPPNLGKVFRVTIGG